MKKLSILDMRKLARERGGKCLSMRYVDAVTSLKWQCQKGHIWKARPNNIKHGKWCPYCAGNKTIPEKDLRRLIQSKNGQLLEILSINGNRRLKIKCNRDGNEWLTYIDVVKKGHWCKVCALEKNGKSRRKYTIIDFKKIAQEKNGKCLSKVYSTTKQILKFQCNKHSYTWETKAENVLAGKWCHKCAGNAQVTIAEARLAAHKKGGKCLSIEIRNSKIPLKWKCANGHIWEASYEKIAHSKTWCPRCFSYYGEESCRLVFETLFKKRFPKVRNLHWLRNAKGNLMELDGYNKSLELAFERHGEQHYNLSTHYIKDTKTLNARAIDDRLKRKLCKKYGIRLIEIPFTVEQEHLVAFIIDKCKSLNIKIPSEESVVDFSKIYPTTNLKEMRALARERNGKCLSNVYMGSEKHLEWQCSKGHTWRAIPYSIKTLRTWCPYCAGNTKIEMSDIEMLAKIREFFIENSLAPSIDNWREGKQSPSVNSYKKRFGSWTNAVRKAGLSPKKWGAGRRKYENDDLLFELRNLAKRLGRVPKAKDLDKVANVPGKNTYILRFGSWRKALAAAGLAHRFAESWKPG